MNFDSARTIVLALLCAAFHGSGQIADPQNSATQNALTSSVSTTNSFSADIILSVGIPAVQADGKLVVTGAFRRPNEQGDYVGPVRFNANGSLDPTFHAPDNLGKQALAIQADGKILVSVPLPITSSISRLNSDGTLDATFHFDPTFSVSALIAQPDGRILVQGNSTSSVSNAIHGLGRLLADGTPDPSFHLTNSADVETMALQPDGKILLAGNLSVPGEVQRRTIWRLNSDGSLDTSFAPNSLYGAKIAMTVQSDGKILLLFDACDYFSTNRNCLIRLHADGTMDKDFSPGVATGPCEFTTAMALQTDGKILVGGCFNLLGGQCHTNLGRLNPDGSVDSTFDAGASDIVTSLLVQPDGRILAGGSFRTLGGQSAPGLAWLTNSAPATQDLSLSNSVITWAWGGAGPELSAVSFDVSPNGIDWVNLGQGARAPGGWQLATSAPSNCLLRASGLVANGSSWFAQQTLQITGSSAPVVLGQTGSATNLFGSTATFRAVGFGSAPCVYQWRKGTNSLADDERIFGAHSSTLILCNVAGADSDDYTVVITNSLGSVTSSIVHLTVIDPVLISSPSNENVTLDRPAGFTVSVAGSQPMQYQWRKAGVPLVDQTNDSLNLGSAQLSDAGSYGVVAGNAFGSVTCAPVVLSINPTTADAFTADANQPVSAMALQRNGGILVGGAFTQLGGSSRAYLGRLQADGTPDTNFNPVVDGPVNCLAVQPDDKILVASVSSYLGLPMGSYLERLNSDGSPDLSFKINTTFMVQCLGLQPDGKIMIGGSSSPFSGIVGPHLIRLLLNGAPDNTFKPKIDDPVSCLAIQPDGKVLVGCFSSHPNYQDHQWLYRLNANGSEDANFAPPSTGPIQSLVLQPDGRILVAESVAFSGTGSYLARLLPNGAADLAFTAMPNSSIVSLALQADGRVLAGEPTMTAIGEPPGTPFLLASSFQRFNPDGSLDTAFQPADGGNISSLALQADGKILVGGSFTAWAGQNRTNLARLNNPDPAAHQLMVAGSTLRWLRTGSSPEVSQVTFEVQRDPTNWIKLGDAKRTGGLWELPNVSLKSNQTVRARGVVCGGLNNGSCWIVEDSVSISQVSRQQVSITLPKTGLRVTNAMYLAQGTAASQASIREVWYQLNNGTWALAEGTSNWSAALNLIPGPNTLRAFAVDSSNTASSVVSNTLTFARLAPMVVQIEGDGTVTPNYNGQLLEIGKAYCMVAKGNHGQVFLNWSGSLSNDAPKLTFVMQSNLVLQANFMTNLFTALKGRYISLLGTFPGGPKPGFGSLTLLVDASGAYSGVAQFGVQRYGLSGRFDASGKAQRVVPWLGKNPVSLQLQAVQSNQFMCYLSDGTNTTFFFAIRAVSNRLAPPLPKPGYFTMAFAAASDVTAEPENISPTGASYATVRLDPMGLITVAGSLADGTKFTQSSALTCDYQWPLCVPLYQNRGGVEGWVAIEYPAPQLNSNGLAGSITWIKPAMTSAKYFTNSFELTAQAVGYRYSPPSLHSNVLAFAEANLQIWSDSTPQTSTQAIRLGKDDRIVSLSTNQWSLQLFRSTGLFQGTVQDPDTGRKLPVQGVLLQFSNQGMGYYLTPAQSGGVIFGQDVPLPQ